MFGIVGIFGYAPSSEPVDLAEVLRIRDAMVARGPDDAGVWYDDTRRIAFGHRRLAIIDISSSGALSREIENTPIRTFTLGFSEYQDSINDETSLAKAVATEYGARHCTSWIAREDFLADLDTLLSVMDQPSTDGVNTYMVCREGRRSDIKWRLQVSAEMSCLAAIPASARYLL
jgi:asparagine synthetase B (glutamine-hydrolysing)